MRGYSVSYLLSLLLAVNVRFNENFICSDGKKIWDYMVLAVNVILGVTDFVLLI